jgi:hypothetical protein
MDACILLKSSSSAIRRPANAKESAISGILIQQLSSVWYDNVSSVPKNNGGF